MRNQILEIVAQHPKRFSQIIRADHTLWQWVQQQSLVESENFAEMIYSAVHQQSATCDRGQCRPWGSFTRGWIFCKNTCECSQISRSQKVTTIKKSLSSEQHAAINQQRQQTMMAKYGVAFNSQRADIHDRWTKPKITSEVHALLTDSQWLDTEYNVKKRNLVDIADQLGIYYSTVGEYCRQQGFAIRQRTNYSQEEMAVSSWLKSRNIPHELGTWDQIAGKELDIFVPEHRLAVEINGLYWHSWHPSIAKLENRQRHLEKSLACEAQGIQLIHITDREWHQQQNQIENLLSSKLGLNRTLGARKCHSVVLEGVQARQLLSQWHLQGWTPAHRCYALVHNQQPVMIVTVGKSRFQKKYQYELLRLASQPGINIVGGLSKLMKFIREDLGHCAIVSYCDRSKSNGQGYLAAGFELEGTTDPGYFWTDGTTQLSRYQSQKKNLARHLANYCPEKSESQNMFDHRWRRYWDCGHWMFVYR